MAARYAWLDRSRMAAIPIGGDPEDFAALRARPAGGEGLLDPTFINFTYVGTFLPRAAPLVERLFSALAEVRRRTSPIGHAAAPSISSARATSPGGGDCRVLPLARAAGVKDLVRETPSRVPYLEALSLLANSAALLLIGSDEPHYTASKIYPALMSGRPWLSLFHSASSAHAILSRAGGGAAIAFADASQLDSSVQGPSRGPGRAGDRPAIPWGRVRPDAIAPYTARAIAGRFAEIFNRVARA